MFTSKGLFRNIFLQPYNDKGNLKVAIKDSKELLQRLTKEKVWNTHQGCVNSLQWNDTGSLLLSAGDDKSIVIADPFSYEVYVNYKTMHRTNIFCAKFLPTQDTRIITCDGNGAILNLDLENVDATKYNFFKCHHSACYELETIPGELNIYLSCSEDRTIHQYDLRERVKCSKDDCNNHILIECGTPISTIAINPVQPHLLAIATVDSAVRIVDRRKIANNHDMINKIVPVRSFTVPHLNHRSYRITSLSYSPDGRDILANYSNEEVYLFSLDSDPNATAILNDFLVNAPNPPPYRRVRLRGDWSDTGPSSVPSARSQRRLSMPAELMAQMNDILINTFNVPTLRPLTLQGWMPGSLSYPVGNRRNNDMVIINRNTTFDLDEGMVTIDIGTFNDFIPVQQIKAKYSGHRNSRTLIKEAQFWGNNFIMSGSDCGHVFIWDRHTCEIVMVLNADSHVINCVQPHPSKFLLATSGVDHNVKLWSPMSPVSNFSQSYVDELVNRNKIMIEESKDTVTISPILVVRMLAHFNRNRNRMRLRGQRNNDMELASSLINPEYSYEEVDNQIPAVEPTYGSTVNLNNNNLSGDDEP